MELRSEDACRGGPRSCPESDGRERCEGCSRIWLDNARRSQAGLLLQRALDTDFALSKHVNLRMCEIPADEWLAMKVLADERDRYNREQKMRGQ